MDNEHTPGRSPFDRPLFNKDGAPGLKAAGHTHPGQRRALNEDAWRIAEEADTARMWARRGRLFAVADGMGGHAAGEVASQLAIEELFGEYYGSTSAPMSPGMRLEQAILIANQKIYEQSAAQTTQAGMGTTIVAAVVRDDWLTIANVGDSRAYMVRDGQPLQITKDHSWVAEQIEAGMLTQSEAVGHIYRSVVTRSVGHHPSIEVDLFEQPLEPGDTILLCSDGLSNQVSDAEIARILTERSPAQAAAELVDLANGYGGPDNITAVVVKLPGVGKDASRVARDTERERTQVADTKPLSAVPGGAEIKPAPGVQPPSISAEVGSPDLPVSRKPVRQRTSPARNRRYVLIAVLSILLCAASIVGAAAVSGQLQNWLATRTPAPTQTGTPTGTALPTLTETPQPTSTPTSTNTPALTLTATATYTPTATPTHTPTFTPTPGTGSVGWERFRRRHIVS